MAVELAGEGNPNEDKELAQVDKVKFKKRPLIKGKQRDQDKPDDANQRSQHEKFLTNHCSFPSWPKISALSFQPSNNDVSLPDPDPYMQDDFDVNGNADNVDKWVGNQDIIEVSHKNPSKVSAAIASEVSSMSLS